MAHKAMLRLIKYIDDKKGWEGSGLEKKWYHKKSTWLGGAGLALIGGCLWGIFSDEQEAKAEGYVLEAIEPIAEFQNLETFLSAFGGYSKEQVLFAFPQVQEPEVLAALALLDIDWHAQALAEARLYQSRRPDASAEELVNHLLQNLFTEAEATSAAESLTASIAAPLGKYGDDLDIFTQALIEKIQHIIQVNEMGDPVLSETDIADIKVVIAPMLAAKNVTDAYILEWVQEFIEHYAQSLRDVY